MSSVSMNIFQCCILKVHHLYCGHTKVQTYLHHCCQCWHFRCMNAWVRLKNQRSGLSLLLMLQLNSSLMVISPSDLLPKSCTTEGNVQSCSIPNCFTTHISGTLVSENTSSKSTIILILVFALPLTFATPLCSISCSLLSLLMNHAFPLWSLINHLHENFIILDSFRKVLVQVGLKSRNKIVPFQNRHAVSWSSKKYFPDVLLSVSVTSILRVQPMQKSRSASKDIPFSSRLQHLILYRVVEGRKACFPLHALITFPLSFRNNRSSPEKGHMGLKYTVSRAGSPLSTVMESCFVSGHL